MFLLIRPISFSAGLISLTLRLLLKFGLGSFNLIKHSFLLFVNTSALVYLCLSWVSFHLCLSCCGYYRLLFRRLLLSIRSIFCCIALFLIFRGWMSYPQMLMLYLLWIVFMLSFNLIWKWLFVFRNYNDLIISNKSLSNWIIFLS